MVQQLIARVREGLFDAVDGAIEILTLGEYGYEPVSSATIAMERSCEGREHASYDPISANRADHALSSA